jgi:hypothetical protein
MSKNTFFRVYNDLSQAERRRILKDTLHGRAVAEQDTIGGRYAAESKQRVVGSASFKYPQLPEGSWGNQGVAVPSEPPLGFSVDAVEPLGTAAEIEQSLREVRDGTGTPTEPSSPGDAEAPRGGSVSTHASRPRRRLSRKG